MTQRKLGKRAGLAARTISRVELGRTTPQIDTMLRILEGLGLEHSDKLKVFPYNKKA